MPSHDETARAAPATDENILEAAGLLRAGALVAFPTETVYGLGGDATDDAAVAAIFEAKGRPSFNPLIIHLSSREAAETVAAFDERARAVAARHWPGPLTLVLPRARDCPVSLLAGAGLETIAVRVPGHPVAHALLNAVGRPVAAPSANRSGAVSPTRAEHVAAELGDAVALILDGGPCPVGIESTVLDLSGETACLLRPGAVTAEDIGTEVGALEIGDVSEGVRARDDGAQILRAPGQLASHYAPKAPLRLGCADPRPGEALLAFGADVPDGFARVLNLSGTGDLTEAAANLFAHLHTLDEAGVSGIATMPIPEVGLGRAINDRLRRAAARD
ncbi:MAG TPA: L-threonylcarbamoyladenylate synthase [Alphaproteobacteria bacterium]|nr:L-threonylcarbamoyladenylate synthase [Alphaproteobacteria bacterium]